MTTSLAGSAFDSLRTDALSDQEALRRAYELPSAAAVRKQMTELTDQTRRLIACSSLVLISSADAEGNCDVSPRGGPAGFVSVLDSRTVAIPDATATSAWTPSRTSSPPAGPDSSSSSRPHHDAPGERPRLRLHPPRAARPADRRGQASGRRPGRGDRGGLPALPQVPHAGGAWKPEQWLPADAQPTSAEVTLAQLRMPELTIADIERTEAESLKYRYE